MPYLTDGELEKISDLLAAGNMANAREIVRLLHRERIVQRTPHRIDGMISRALGELLRNGADTAAKKRA